MLISRQAGACKSIKQLSRDRATDPALSAPREQQMHAHHAQLTTRAAVTAWHCYDLVQAAYSIKQHVLVSMMRPRTTLAPLLSASQRVLASYVGAFIITSVMPADNAQSSHRYVYCCNTTLCLVAVQRRQPVPLAAGGAWCTVLICSLHCDLTALNQRVVQ